MKRLVFLFLAVVAGMYAIAAPKPRWVSRGEGHLNAQRTNHSYYFAIVRSDGADLDALRQHRVERLAERIGQTNNLRSTATTEMTNTQTGETALTAVQFRIVFTGEASTPVFHAQQVDDYWEFRAGTYTYYALFAVSDQGEAAVFDRFDVTRSYGVLPAVMSVVPGAGQLYKGSKAKGIGMLAGAAVGVGAIVYCENERSSYVAKMHEQPRHATTYKTRADNFETARNVAIGVTGALMVWSVVDAAVAPGATQIRVRRDEQLRVSPTAMLTPSGATAGISFRLTF